MKFFAHSTEENDQSGWHLLSDHLCETGKLAAENAAYFDGNSMATIAGRLHDLGKYTRDFQDKLEGHSLKVDHSTRGAQVAIERFGNSGRLLAYGIAGHHAGLANGRDRGERTPLTERLIKELPCLEPQWQNEIELAEKTSLPSNFDVNQERGYFQLSFLGRMLFSSLVDADFRDTEAFFARTEGRDVERKGFPTLEQLRDRLNETLAQFRPDTPLNETRKDILEHARGKAEEAPGLFSMTVPTGGGKTLTSLAFALDHAIQHGLRRVIFVIPFTSIVEQNAAVFRSALGDLGNQAILEHHSAFRDDRETAPQSGEKLRRAMENWEAPIVVTTSVQFFESLYADRPSTCRKLHNVSGSVVILDEAQTLPLKLLRPCIAVMDELARNYRTSLVLCTATQPALKEHDEFKGGLPDVRELAPEPKNLFQKLKRVELRHVGRWSDTEIAQRLTDNNQALCIVNNRRHARALYEAIKDQPGARHLTTLMCAAHRSNFLGEIREMLNQGEPCRLVSTSLIEAGVDVDFPLVLRAETGLDSIAQAAGRCNREGKRDPSASPVDVFSGADEWPTPPELEQFAQAARSIFRHYPDDPLSLDAINSYFRELYWQKGESKLDEHDILSRIAAGQIDNIPYEWMAQSFRMIESTMVPIIIPYDTTARETLNALRYANHVGGLARKLQPYLVQIPEQGYKALRSVGAIQAVQPDRFGEQFLELANPDLYDDRYGLNWDDPGFIRAENSVF